MSLSPQQRRILKQHAGIVIESLLENPTPLWSSVGDDTRQKIYQQLLLRLRESQNTGIADVVDENPDLLKTCLQEKVRSLRHNQRKKCKYPV